MVKLENSEPSNTHYPEFSQQPIFTAGIIFHLIWTVYERQKVFCLRSFIYCTPLLFRWFVCLYGEYISYFYKNIMLI